MGASCSSCVPTTSEDKLVLVSTEQVITNLENKNEDKLESPQQETTSSEYTRIKKKDLSAIEERVEWYGQKLLGLRPNLWLEVLDKEHRHGTFLYPYWQRWEKSHTDLDFFDWLDEGPGKYMDLPEKPRRMLEEGKILYLKNEQQKLFKVSIQKDGRFTWDFDGLDLTVPGSKSKTERQKEIDKLLKDRIQEMEKRDGALHALKDVVNKHLKDPDLKLTHPDVETVCANPDLTGLLWQLRDEYFQERWDPPRQESSGAYESKYKNQEDFRTSAEFLKCRLYTWDDIYKAVMHDLGESEQKKEEKQKKGEKQGKKAGDKGEKASL